MTEQKENCTSTSLGGGMELYSAVKDGSTIELYTNALDVKEHKNENIIEKITFGNFTVGTGEYFTHSLSSIPSKYKIKHITTGAENKKFRYSYTLKSHIRNKTSQYLLPTIAPRNSVSHYFCYDSFFINAYLSESWKELKLLYRFSTHDEYTMLEKRLSSTRTLIGTEDVEEGLDLFTFSIPETYSWDVEKFMDGKYSRMDNLLKTKIKNFYRLGDNNFVWQVLTKDAKLFKEMLKKYNCNASDFYGVDLDIKPKEEEEIWKYYQQ